MSASRSPAEASTPCWPRLVVAGVRAFYLWVVTWLVTIVVGAAVVFGFDPILIVSGSMSPAILPGDVVLTAPPQLDRLGPGTVVTFVDPARAERLVTHRVDHVLDDGRLRTRGDANAVLDSTPVAPDDVVGAGRVLVPLVGLPLVWLRDGQTAWFGAWAVLTLIALFAPGGGSGSLRSDEPRPRRRSTQPTGPSVASAPVDVSGRLWHAHSAPAVPPSRRTSSRAAATLAVVCLGVLAPAAPLQALSSSTAVVDNRWTAATLAPPTDLDATGGCQLLGLVTGPKVDLTWSAVPADGYVVLRSGTDGGPYAEVQTLADGSATSWTDGDVALGETYHYVVRALGGTWTSADSEQATATTPSLCVL